MSYQRKFYSLHRNIIKKPETFCSWNSKRKKKPLQRSQKVRAQQTDSVADKYGFGMTEQTQPRCCVPDCHTTCLLYRFDSTGWVKTALGRRRARCWIAALQVAPCHSREVWVCRRHFKGGFPSQDPHNIDWVPSQNLERLPANPCQECAVLLARIPSDDPTPPAVDVEDVVIEVSDEEEEDADEAERLRLVAVAMRLVIEDMEREAKSGEVFEKEPVPEAPQADMENIERDTITQAAIQSLRDEFESETVPEVPRKRRRRN